jgi:starch phosphorylase
MATLGMPGIGYGINYEFGLFRQTIVNGEQVERAGLWRRHGSPWQVERPDDTCVVPMYGRVEAARDEHGDYRPRWVDYETVLGVPFDLPVAGYGGRGVTMLRLYSARASDDLDVRMLQEGDYPGAVEKKAATETISKVLYPRDRPEPDSLPQLAQDYFLVACALRDIVRRWARGDGRRLPRAAAVQMNGTQPVLAVAELMRILVDEQRLPWDLSWEITTGVLAYTHHTLLGEALEKWPVEIFGRLLPRHLEIVHEINRRFLNRVLELWPGDHERARRMSIIEEGEIKKVRMAHLAAVGSHSLNGVAAVQTELVRRRIFQDFHELWPEKFNNKTNGISPRRWLLGANPDLAALITEAIGDKWITDLEELRRLEPLASDAAFGERFRAVKTGNKHRLALLARRTTGQRVDDDALVDSQLKRVHEYKRQLLNVLHIVHHYLEIVERGRYPKHRRAFVFAGKAAPGYPAARQVIRLIHAVRDMVASDSVAAEWMCVLFLPDYGVSVAETVIPASDVSEQISTAGFEASGTSSMKFALNGALTIGTHDGANVEIAGEVGPANLFLFGNTVDELATLRDLTVHPRTFYERSEGVRRVLDFFRTDRMSTAARGQFAWVFDKLVENWDPYFHLADLEDYLATQARVDSDFAVRAEWTRRAILNVARMGRFSSDRTVLEYAREIWGLNVASAAGG